MDTTGYVTLSRQIALQRQMTVLAGNVANASTTGYKATRLWSAELQLRAGAPGTLAFTGIGGEARDPSMGPLLATGERFDLAISGPGLFAVMTPQGERYTRAGHFGLDAGGNLVTPQGHQLLEEAGAPVVIRPEDGAVEVTADGTLMGRGGPIARLRMVEADDRSVLREEGAGLYASEQAPPPLERRRVVQGSLESSNVQPIMEMTRLMETLRAFEATQRLVDTHHGLARSVIERAAGRES
ncbi:flagellar hook-basal body complex protein [Marinimicrococcus flavescens]|uniref:Flagellar hook-basal body complex protein n=1 Tax=Marinimicrococcus flavescens TaxID=3031815 RepID=A0AAP3XPQ1_9PROT|nr:flagellar hook-basal body complex protein [Marinimicrococcus flavescens]